MSPRGELVSAMSALSTSPSGNEAPLTLDGQDSLTYSLYSRLDEQRHPQGFLRQPLFRTAEDPSEALIRPFATGNIPESQEQDTMTAQVPYGSTLGNSLVPSLSPPWGTEAGSQDDVMLQVDSRGMVYSTPANMTNETAQVAQGMLDGMDDVEQPAVEADVWCPPTAPWI
jgi:hypothetical protein